MRVPELEALAREYRLRGYSRMRRPELIELIRNNQWNTDTPLQSWEASIALVNQNAEWGLQGIQSNSSTK